MDSRFKHLGVDPFHISLFNCEDRESQSWVLTETPLGEEQVLSMIAAHHSVLNVFISEPALCVFPVAVLPRQEGRITDTVGFIAPEKVSAPMPSVVVNTPFLDILPGDTFFESLGALEPLVDASDIALQAFFIGLANEYSFHCVGVVV